MNPIFPTFRLRRLRQHPVIRDLVRETELNLDDLIHAIFIKGEEGEKNPISSMPGHYQIPLSKLDEEIEEIVDLGIKSLMVFGVPSFKDGVGSDSFSDDGIMQKAIRQIRKVVPDLLIISDICLCQYTDHGHCGVMDDHTGCVDLNNDKTLEILVKQSISHVRAGANMLAPSGMIDGQIMTIRRGLDEAGFSHIPIMGHTAKYSSSMYGPFRQATEGAPKFGDRSTYQMDPANGREALREAAVDVNEGADILLIKPAHTYLDVIYRVKQAYPQIPLCAYHPSAEFSMIKAAAANGWINERKIVFEVLTSIKRAGADFMVTYYTKEVAGWMRENKI
ncbi:MAG: porphobilinogen synthase [Alphaproteobacteria bacterium]|nr:porphobilinogen synthase [Alphaproteobacteria bacterium]